MKRGIESDVRLQDLPMRTWVAPDARSVSAMLDGHGDGRDLIYKIYIKVQGQLHSTQSTEELMANYTRIVATCSWLKLDASNKKFGYRIISITFKCIRLAFFLWRTAK